MSLTAHQMQELADLTADQARERMALALQQGNDREAMTTRQAEERVALARKLGLALDQVDQVAGTTAPRAAVVPNGAARPAARGRRGAG